MPKLIDQVSKFIQTRKGLLKMLADLEGRANEYESLMELFGGEEILFAVLL